jgi:hypothetical protein
LIGLGNFLAKFAKIDVAQHRYRRLPLPS